MIGPVDDLDEPDDGEEADHHEQRLARLGQHRWPVRIAGAQVPGPAARAGCLPLAGRG